MYNKYSIYQDILVDSLHIEQAIYRIIIYTNSDFQRRKWVSISFVWTKNTVWNRKLRCSNSFLIHNRYILHVNIMHKDMTPNALTEKKKKWPIVIVHIMLKMNYSESVQLGQLNSFKTQNSRPQKNSIECK